MGYVRSTTPAPSASSPSSSSDTNFPCFRRFLQFSPLSTAIESITESEKTLGVSFLARPPSPRINRLCPGGGSCTTKRQGRCRPQVHFRTPHQVVQMHLLGDSISVCQSGQCHIVPNLATTFLSNPNTVSTTHLHFTTIHHFYYPT